MAWSDAARAAALLARHAELQRNVAEVKAKYDTHPMRHVGPIGGGPLAKDYRATETKLIQARRTLNSFRVKNGIKGGS